MGLLTGATNQDTSDDWCVDGSDDEKYDPSKSGKGIWEPSAAKILELFDRVGKEKVLELKWKCPGRRPPEAEKEEEDESTQMSEEEMEQETPVEETKQQKPTEFDFDDTAEDLKVTPRHTPGSKTPKSQKKVARMDKVLQDIMTQRKQSAARRMVQGRSPRTPLGSGRGRLSPGSSPGTPPTSANRASPGATPLRPPNKDGLDMPPIKNIMKGNENPGTSAQDIESVLNNPSILEKTKGIENSGKPNQKIEKLPNNPSVKEPKTECTDNKDVPSSTEPSGT